MNQRLSAPFSRSFRAKSLVFSIAHARMVDNYRRVERRIAGAGGRNLVTAVRADRLDGAAGDEHPSSVFWWHIALSWVYTAMVVFALPEATDERVGFAVVGSLAVGLHLIYKDYVLRSHYHAAFEEKGRYLLAVAPLAGWLVRVIMNPTPFA